MARARIPFLLLQGRDELLREPLPPPQKFVDLTDLRQAQRELGL
jgi:hypothetical protein